MALLLEWGKRNNTPVITEIYRGDAPLDRAALPAPLVTLSNQETRYYDLTAVAGQQYHYMWVTYDMDHKSPAYSSSKAITAAQRRGVGPNVLITGDANCGYYGDVSASELVSGVQLLAAQNAGSTPLALTGFSLVWRKCIFKGKVLYIPSLPQFLTAWTNVYRAGFAYGDFDRTKLPVAPNIDPSYSIPQNRRITIAGDEYIVRMMRGYTDDLSRPVPSNLNTTAIGVVGTVDTTPSPYYFNEYDAFFLSNLTTTPPLQGLPNYLDSQQPTNTIRYGTLCAELRDGAVALSRGGSFEVNSASAGRMFLQQFRGIPTSSDIAVALVLELVEA